ncbi:PAS domain S-box protein [Marinoscillum sp. MHG1-6]|uniref:PAS domain-containing sensor histidine kinase n=1 Tax=Marinoscillum sp. MHG1-6 TaxID=2959627 RepID=UPI0021575CED|nr:PAS domain S-box protein [Marinoscillum sp. MHG1-6]
MKAIKKNKATGSTKYFRFRSWFAKGDRLQKELEEKEKIKRQLSTFVKYAPGAIAMFDKDMQYLMASDSWYQDYKLSEDEITGRSHYEIFPQILDMPHWLKYHQEALSGKSISVEKDEMTGSDGSTIYLKYRIEPWRDHNNEIGGIIMFTENITEQVNIQNQLQENQQYLKDIFDHSSLGICLVDESGKLFMVNDRMCEIVGYPREDLTKMNFTEFTHPEDIEIDLQLFNNLKNKEISQGSIDKRYISKSGKISHVKLHASVINDPNSSARHALVLVQDVTEEVKANEASKVANEKFETLNALMEKTWEIAQMGSWKLDITSQKVEWSKTIYQIHELEENIEIDLDKMKSFIHRKDLTLVNEALDQAYESGCDWDLDLRIITKTGRECWIRFIGHPIIKESQIIGIEGLIKNVDQIKKINLELTELNAMLEHTVDQRTAQLEAVNKELEAFAYSISHDLRAPLRAIEGFSSALKEDFDEELDRSAKHYLQRIQDNTVKMGDLIDDLLEFSRTSRSVANPQIFNLKEKLENLIEEMEIPPKYQIELINISEAYGDPRLLTQVFQNLLSNAVKYSAYEETPVIYIEQTSRDDGYEVSISDNGIGFDMRYSHQLFKIFQRLHSDDEYEGTGIGLALCQRIVQRHLGKIWAESSPGVGSKFTIFLPNNTDNNEVPSTKKMSHT